MMPLRIVVVAGFAVFLSTIHLLAQDQPTFSKDEWDTVNTLVTRLKDPGLYEGNVRNIGTSLFDFGERIIPTLEIEMKRAEPKIGLRFFSVILRFKGPRITQIVQGEFRLAHKSLQTIAQRLARMTPNFPDGDEGRRLRDSAGDWRKLWDQAFDHLTNNIKPLDLAFLAQLFVDAKDFWPLRSGGVSDQLQSVIGKVLEDRIQATDDKDALGKCQTALQKAFGPFEHSKDAQEQERAGLERYRQIDNLLTRKLIDLNTSQAPSLDSRRGPDIAVEEKPSFSKEEWDTVNRLIFRLKDPTTGDSNAEATEKLLFGLGERIIPTLATEMKRSEPKIAVRLFDTLMRFKGPGVTQLVQSAFWTAHNSLLSITKRLDRIQKYGSPTSADSQEDSRLRDEAHEWVKIWGPASKRILDNLPPGDLAFVTKLYIEVQTVGDTGWWLRGSSFRLGDEMVGRIQGTDDQESLKRCQGDLRKAFASYENSKDEKERARVDVEGYRSLDTMIARRLAALSAAGGRRD